MINIFILVITQILKVNAKLDENSLLPNSLPYSCAVPPDMKLVNGFTVNWFPYPNLNDQDTFEDPDFLSFGYKSMFGPSENTLLGVTNASFSVSPPLEGGCIFSPNCEGCKALGVPCSALVKEYWGDEIYGYNTTYTNVVIELTGMIYASQSGNYTISLTNVDDGASLFIGTQSTFQCCSPNIVPVPNANEAALTTLKQCSLCPPSATAYSMQLEAGFYYPMRLVWVNVVGPAKMTLEMTLPDGSIIQDFTGIVFSSPDDNGNCPAITTITDTWTGTETSTTTVAPVDDNQTTTVEILVPTTNFITTTEPWNESIVSTSTIFGIGLTETVVIFTPTHQLVTTTEEWTETYVSTTTITGSELTDTIIVYTPTIVWITTTSPWSDSVVSTSTVHGLITQTVVVYTPTTTYMTKTLPWTGEYTFTTTDIVSGLTETVFVYTPTADPFVKSMTNTTNTPNTTTTTESTTTTVTITTDCECDSPNTVTIQATGYTETVFVYMPKVVTTTVTSTSLWTEPSFSTSIVLSEKTEIQIVYQPCYCTALSTTDTVFTTLADVVPTPQIVIESNQAAKNYSLFSSFGGCILFMLSILFV